MTHKSNIEEATCSLIREYLSRKGFKGTLDKMDEECPRNEHSISNRQALMKFVNLDKLMKKNKEQQTPFKTMLEIMTQNFLEKGVQSPKGQGTGNERFNDDNSPGLSNNMDFMPQDDEPGNRPLMKSLTKPSTASLKTRREKRNDLVMDDDVEGETMLGGGKTGILATETSSDVNSTSQRQHFKRPLSAKQKAGAIMSNNDLTSSRRRVPSAKSAGHSRLSVSQQQQQQIKQSNEPYTHQSKSNGDTSYNGRKDSSSSLYSSPANGHSSSVSNNRESESRYAPPPISFEALLMKGEERANLLQRVGLDRKNSEQDDNSYSIEDSSMVAERPPSRHSQRKSSNSNSQRQPLTNKIADLELGDVDDFDTDTTGLELKRGVPLLQQPNLISKLHSVAIDIKTAMNLKNLVLGSPCQLYTDEWLLQAFSFCDMPDLKYGIVQKKGGSCGVLAAVQACLLQEILFSPEKLHAHKWSNPTRQERTRFLGQAVARILWRAGCEERAVVTIPTQNIQLVTSSKFKQDGVTETLSLYTFTDFEGLSSFLSQSVSHFEVDGNAGVILLMYSTILSRKPHLVKSDFDTLDSKMIAAHGYCTQELVNLILTGRAVSNVFNDVVELDSGEGQDCVILKGLTGRCDIGYLSLFEHYKSCQVGTYYKTPKYPIWLICSESHFSVMFCTRRDLVNDWKAEKRFDLIYYDGLARQQEEIRLSISTINPSFKPSYSEEDLVPPLECIIRTKWNDAEIDWNGYDPIL